MPKISGAQKIVSIVWFRRDLRLADNPALVKAIEAGGEILPVYIYSPEEEGLWKPGAASNWWLHHSLQALDHELQKLGSRLVLRRGPAKSELLKLAAEIGASGVFWNRLYEPEIIKRDTQIKQTLIENNIQAHSFNAALLVEPWNFKNQSGKPFQVFTPFWKSLQKVIEDETPLARPKEVKSPAGIGSESLQSLKLLPEIPWDIGFNEAWSVGEIASEKKLKDFLLSKIGDYSKARDIPSVKGTSRISAHLHFGEISPRQIFYAVKKAQTDPKSFTTPEGTSRYLTEIAWREFAHHLLFHFPHTPTNPLREKFNSFQWSKDKSALTAWQKGLTGYPIVDAGMRELWHTGWMHNRVRMIVGSFLVKDLLISWVEGARWFWDTLVDASLANNTMGWQWVGGCGADAAPFFRIFNPITQGEKFDPEGEYVRKWVPELKQLPDSHIHKPWEAPEALLEKCGIKLGNDYPRPIVDHKEARSLALGAFKQI